MKKIIAILLICFMLLPLASCKETPTDKPQELEREKVHLVVLAGQSGARGKALVNDLSEEDKEDNIDVDILADGLPMDDLVDIPGIDGILSDSIGTMVESYELKVRGRCARCLLAVGE